MFGNYVRNDVTYNLENAAFFWKEFYYVFV